MVFKSLFFISSAIMGYEPLFRMFLCFVLHSWIKNYVMLCYTKFYKYGKLMREFLERFCFYF